jgi:hypothetical protein
VHRLSTSFVLGYHGCADAVAESVLAGQAFMFSRNDYDCLGPGVYFWQSNPERALQFATEKQKRDKASWKPALVGAVIDLGLCLDLTTQTAIEHIKSAHSALARVAGQSGVEIPSNYGGKDLLLRKLDCAVVSFLHDIRESAGHEPIDTVSGIFVEGRPVYENSGFYEKTHVQLCVRNPAMIKGVFRVAHVSAA